MSRAAAGLAIAAALVALTASACGGAGDDPAASKSTAADKSSARDIPPGRFAFKRFLDDAQTQGAVFTIKTDGSGEKQITHPPTGTSDDQPDWSPDGKRIAFERCSETTGCVAMVVAARGGKPRRVKMKCRLSGGCDASAPAWTPDGRLVIELAQGTEKVKGEARQIQRQSLELVNLSTGAQRTIVAPEQLERRPIGTGRLGRWPHRGLHARELLADRSPAFAVAFYAVHTTAPATGGSLRSSSAAGTVRPSPPTELSSSVPTTATTRAIGLLDGQAERQGACPADPLQARRPWSSRARTRRTETGSCTRATAPAVPPTCT